MYLQATALWRWSNYLQHLDPPEKIQVLINVDETSVRLVPEDGKGHISNRAYRLLCSGVPMGRNASLAAQRSAITHVTAICDHPEIQNRLPQVVLVGENQLNAGRASRLLSEAIVPRTAGAKTTRRRPSPVPMPSRRSGPGWRRPE